MPNLKIVKLVQLDYLTTFPDVSWAPNIEKVLVWDCKNLVDFHKSIGSLKRISSLYVRDCERLRHLPSRLEMESLETLSITRCSSLERFPDMSPCMINLSKIELDCCCSIEGLLSSLGHMSSLEYLHLERDESSWKVNTPMCKEYPEKHGCRESLVEDETKALESLPKLINLNTPIESLIELNLIGRPMEIEFFLKNLHSFSSLEYLDLRRNNNLIRLPATISHLSFLKCIYLNECHRLKILQGLPSSIEILEANNCYSLEKIDDLSEGYPCLRRISFCNCHKVEKMLQLSFTKWTQRWSFIHRIISIVIPGNNIPRWFKEEEQEVQGSTIRVMIPPECNNEQIKGIALCVVIPPDKSRCYFGVQCYFEKDGVSSDKKDFGGGYEFLPFSDKENMLIYYRKYDSIRGFQREEWYGGTLIIEVVDDNFDPMVVRCAAHPIYESDADDTDDYREKATLNLLNPVVQSP